MASHDLDHFFNPSSIAVIGASDRRNSVGMKVFKNLLKYHFKGKLFAVNPQHKSVQDQPCFASVKDIPQIVDLAVITTPASTVPDIIAECGEKGIRAALVISAGFGETGKAGKEAEQALLALARRHKIRIMGPNCLGLMRPLIQLNASFDNNFTLGGSIALVSQSGAICAAILDWAVGQHIGFSAMVSLGNCADVDFGDILDYLTLDPNTHSILLYVEGIRNAKHFVSGLRAAARSKPVIVIKGGKNAQGSRAALSHTGALIGDDDVFDAALKRAGVVRVMSIEQLFSAAEVFSSNYRVKGNRLTIITNGGGAGVMAADRASELNVELPPLNEKILAQFNKELPAQWSHQNPIDILGDATPERYHHVIDTCKNNSDSDALLTILVPVAMSQPLKVAEQVIKDAKTNNLPLFACWMGEHQVKSSRRLFTKNQVPHFNTPEKAVEAFSYLATYQHNQQLLLQAPKPYEFKPQSHVDGARKIIEPALTENRTLLSTLESKKLLKMYGIPVNEVFLSSNADQAVELAEKIGYPVAMKINSPDISHKQDAGGVQLNILNADAVRLQFNAIIANAKKFNSAAKIIGVTVERMYSNPNNRELMVGIISDKVFGPVISFGAGGNLVEILRDRCIELPPLNPFLAEQMIEHTRIAKALKTFRNMPAIPMDQLIQTLLRVSEMICDCPYIQEMDINPLIANEKEIVALDARIVVAPVTQTLSMLPTS